MANVVKKSWRAVAALLGAAATVVAMSSPATAATQDVYFEGNDIDLTVVQADQTISCPTFDLAGTYDGGGSVGVLDDLTASGCTNPIVGPTSFTPYGALEFDIWFDEHESGWKGNISNIELEYSAVGCTLDIAGSVEASFDPSSQKLEVVTSDLQIATVPSGFLCPIVGYAQGQDIEIEGHWINTGTPITFP